MLSRSGRNSLAAQRKPFDTLSPGLPTEPGDSNRMDEVTLTQEQFDVIVTAFNHLLVGQYSLLGVVAVLIVVIVWRDVL